MFISAKKNKSKKKKRPNKENCTVQVKEELYVSNQTQDNTFDAKQTNDHKESSNVLQTAQKYSDVARPQINAVNLMPDVTVNVVPRGDQKGLLSIFSNSKCWLSLVSSGHIS